MIARFVALALASVCAVVPASASVTLAFPLGGSITQAIFRFGSNVTSFEYQVGGRGFGSYSLQLTGNDPLSGAAISLTDGGAVSPTSSVTYRAAQGLSFNSVTFFGRSTDADPRNTFAVTVTNAISATVPEPATWAMMIVGFGLVGASMRRRSVAVSFA